MINRSCSTTRPSSKTVTSSDAKLGGIAAKPNPCIFLSAGEASGDHYGAQIIAELRRRIPAATFVGLGGTEMEAVGQHRIVRAEDVAHMGITEVVQHMPYIFTQYRKLVAVLKQNKAPKHPPSSGLSASHTSQSSPAQRPGIAILIDFPDVNFRLAKHCCRLGIPVAWFVSPQLWAWKRRRLRWVQQRVSKMLVIFPFEEPFYRHRNVDATFVGHPLAALPLPEISREDYAAEYGLDPSKQWIALLPGSREKEIEANLPATVVTAGMLGDTYEYLVPVASTVTPEFMNKAIAYAVIYPENHLSYNGTFHLVPDARDALYHSRAAIVASGTATVQALTIGNPFVVVYRVSRLTFALAKRLVHYPAEIGDEAALKDADGNLPIAMPNLIAGRRIVPELLNDRFNAQNLAAALRPLLDDTPERVRMIADLAETRAKLLPPSEPGSPEAATPIQRVCDVIEDLLSQVHTT